MSASLVGFRTMLKGMNWETPPVVLLRGVIGIVFIVAGMPKLLHPHDFLNGVFAYELVGPKTGLLVAVLLPSFELVTGVCLLGGILSSGSSLAALLMSLLFVYVQSVAIYSELDISCSCFGSVLDLEANTINYTTLMRAVALLCGSGVLVWASFRESTQAKSVATT